MIILKNLPLPHRYRRSGGGSGGGSGSAAMDISVINTTLCHEKESSLNLIKKICSIQKNA
jgi:hypothetical protein